MMLEVKFYCLTFGKEPVREWLKSLVIEDKKSIGEDIRVVQGRWPLGMPLVRKMEPDLWEVRTHLKDGIARVFFTIEGSEMILLHGIIKKSHKTPTKEINLAGDRLKDWKRSVKA